MSALDVTISERRLLVESVRARSSAVAKQRAITERHLAAGLNTGTNVRIAYYEELDLAALDALLTKVRAA